MKKIKMCLLLMFTVCNSKAFAIDCTDFAKEYAYNLVTNLYAHIDFQEHYAIAALLEDSGGVKTIDVLVAAGFDTATDYAVTIDVVDLNGVCKLTQDVPKVRHVRWEPLN